MLVAAVPVKDLVNAKQRLVPALAVAERAALAAAMLEDVLTALAAARLDRVWVVTREPAVSALASRSSRTPTAGTPRRWRARKRRPRVWARACSSRFQATCRA